MKKFFRTKKGWHIPLGCMALSALTVGAVVGFTACEEEETPNYANDGSYYLSAIDGEYELSMSAGQCTLKVNDETKFGTYQCENNALQFVFADGTTASGLVKDGNISFVCGDVTLVLLKKVQYTVSYSVEGEVVSTVKVLNGKTISKPVNPQKENHYFVGWYTDAEYKTPFLFNGEQVFKNTTLYARFTPATVGQNEFSVNYIVDGEVIAVQPTVAGVVYDMPTPQKENATFVGWWMSDYQDAEKLTCQYTGQVLSHNVNLYAVWSSKAPMVSVNEAGVKWNAVGAGASYTVTIKLNGETVATQKTTSLEFAYDFASKTAGDYEVEIESGAEKTTVYYQNKALDRVSLFEVSETGVLTFNAVKNAEKYIITIDCGNDKHEHEELDNGTFTYFDFSNCEMQEGGITFTVKAIANGYVTSESEVYSYIRNLDSITRVSFNEEEGMLYWNPVSKATAYRVVVKANGDTYTHELQDTKISLIGYTGEVEVKVYAIADGYNASKIEYNYVSNRIQAPTGLTLDYDTLKWTAAPDAVKYNVKIGSTVYETTATSFELPEEYRSRGEIYNVSVQAVAGEGKENSYFAETVAVKYGLFDNVYYGNGMLNWGSVGGAYKYVVTINDNKAQVGSQTEFSGSLSAGELTFKKSGLNKVVIKALDKRLQTLDTKEVYVTTSEIVFDTCTSEGVKTFYKAVGDKIKIDDPTSAGYDFAGWYNIPNGVENNGSMLGNLVFTNVSANKFYAAWAPKEYTVTLKVGDEVVGTETVLYGREFTLSTTQSPDKANAFYGWFAQDNASGRQFTNAKGEGAVKWNNAEDVTLYAGWISVLDYEEINYNGGKAYQVKKAAGIEYVTEVTIPETYNDKKVVGIAPGAFANCDHIETIYIPDTIESIFIGDGSIHATSSAFYRCTNLKNVHVYCVDDEHGEDADHETYFSSEDGVLIRHAAPSGVMEFGTELYFFPAAKTGDYTVPSNVNHIPRRTFYRSMISSVTIPASVQFIGKNAFNDSDNLEKVVFTEAGEGEDAASTLTLENGAFGSCGVLQSVTLPKRLEETNFKDKSIFLYSYKLAELNVNKGAGSKFYTSNNGMLCSVDGKELLYCPTGRVGEVEIPVAIEEIGANAFDSCTKITSVKIGDNVSKIGANAFYNCTKLETIDFRGETGSMEIASKAFYGCSVLKELVIPVNVTKVGAQAFGKTQNLKYVTLNGGANVEYANNVFMDDTGYGYVTHLTLGKTLGEIEINGVFSGCSIADITIVEGNEHYYEKDDVLYDADQTKVIFYPFGKTEETFEFLDTVTEIAAGAFVNKTNLKTIVINKNITKIGDNAFKGAVALETVTFEESRTENLTLGNNVFDGCLALATVTLPEKTTSIGNSVFNKCNSLTSVTLPTTLATMGDNVFAECSKLAAVNVTPGNTAVAAKNGILYAVAEGALTEIKFIPAGLKGEVELPKTLTQIVQNQFKGNTGITKITFEDNTAPVGFTIGASAFESMSALKEIVLPTNLEVIPANAFKGASALTTVTIPNTVTNIQKAAFLNCKKLATVTFEEGGTADLTIASASSSSGESSNSVFYAAPVTELKLPERMTEISSGAFRYSGIKKVIIPSTVKKIGEYAFNNSKSLTEVVFAKDAEGNRALEEVQNGAFSYTALKEVTVPGSITNFTFGSSTTWHQMFYTCTALETVIMEEGWTEIPASTFNGCSKLATIKTLKADGTIVDGMPSTIKTIKIQAFMNCKALATLKLSDNLTSICDSAFSGCNVLTAIEIPATVTTIEKNAFGSCTALASVSFATGSKISSIGDKAFSKVAITEIEIPAHADVTEFTFGASVFENCASLTTATIPSSIKDLNNAFAGCSALTDLNYETEECTVDKENKFIYGNEGKTIVLYYGNAEEIVIPEEVTEIAKGAFAARTSVKSVTFHANVTTIHDYAFQNCSNLATVVIPEDSKLTQIGVQAFEATGLTEITLPESLVVREANAGLAIGKRAFYNSKSLTKAVVKGTAMGEAMFEGCSALADVTLNDTIETFKGTTFKGTAIATISLPSALKTVGASEFESCTKLTEITLPDALETVGTNMFKGCTSLATVNLSQNLKTVAGNMFQNCTSLTSIVLPEGVESIGTYAFASCTSLTSITFPSTLKTIASMYTFQKVALETFDISNTQVASIPMYMMPQNTALKTIKLPESVTALTYANAFQSCTNIETVIAPGVVNVAASGWGTKLKTVVLSEDLHTIGNNAFKNCVDLTEFNFTDALTKIGDGAFQGSGITEAYLGTALTTIGKNAFNGTALKKVTIPAGVTSIGDAAFANCKSLETISVDSGNANYRGGDYGELYDANDKLLVFPANSTGDNGYVKIAEGVQLNANAFEGTVALNSVELPSTLVTIPDKLFLNSSIKTVIISEGTRELGANVFQGCTQLEMVEFPDSVAVIGGYTFQDCTALTKVVLPEYLETISNRMFMNCTSLTEVVMPRLLKKIDAGAFINTAITTLDCGDNLEDLGTLAFQNAKIQYINLGTSLKNVGGLVFENSDIVTVTFPAGIVMFGTEDLKKGNNSQAFLNCTKLESVVFEDAPQTMYKEAFKGCTALTSVTLNGNWTEIPEGMFQGCTALTTIVIPETVTTIGKNAFEGSGLTSIVIPASVTTLGVGASSGGGLNMGGRAAVSGGTTALNSLAFANCVSLETVVFEGAPTNMYGGTFKGCTALTSVTLNGNWTKLEASMFEGCTSLTNFTIPESVTSIGANAFKDWTAEQTILVPHMTEAEATAKFGANWNGSATVVYKQEEPTA